MEKAEQPNVEFFIKELESISTKDDRRYASLSRRVADLEASRPSSSVEDDMTKAIVSVMVLGLVVQAGITLLEMWMNYKKENAA